MRKYTLTSLALAIGLFALLGIDAAPAHAQVGKITGVVTDATTGEPLAGVQVYLEGTGRGSLTADNGRYFIINIPTGTYAVVAEMIGYATFRRENVLVAIDITRTVDFALTPEAIAVEEIIVEAEAVPLIETTATGASDAISSVEITALPVGDIGGALALRSGFLQVPQNTDVISLEEERRGLSPVRIRGGRAGETLTLIDGVPINNFVFGGPAFDITPYAVTMLDYVRGGFEPQYGNALSGIVNIATREGGTQLEGALEFQTSRLGGALGIDHDDLLNSDQWQGYVGGPVPGTAEKLRFVMAGRTASKADRVMEFDGEIYNPFLETPEFGFNQPQRLDLFPGWRALGFDQKRDLFGKLTYYFTPTMKLSAFGIDYQRQRQNADFQWQLATWDAIAQCNEQYGDGTEVCDAVYGFGRTSQYRNLAYASYRLDRNLFAAYWDHSIGRARYTLTASRLYQKRETCNFFQGICMEDNFADPNFNENFHAPGTNPFHPTAPGGSGGGTDFFFGGEDLTTYMVRGDVQWQATDHHDLQAGVFYQTHNLDYVEALNRGTNDVFVIDQSYLTASDAPEPWDGAVYIQDRIEYDFLTIKLGFRFDYGRAGGLFFVNPLDPINGTDAFTVCENPQDWQNVTIKSLDEQGRWADTLVSANLEWDRQFCIDNRDALNEAADIARADDFTETKRRNQFSPRIGVSFPVTANSNIFFNFGRFSQNPLYHNLYRNTSIGTQLEATPEGYDPVFTTEYTASLLGNANLLIESTTAYEVGYLAEVGDDYALSTIVFTKDQMGLTGVVTGGVDEAGRQVFDPGATYGPTVPNYNVLVNQDFATVRGLEVSLRRRVVDNWGFDINYQWSQARTNAAPPDRQIERLDEGESQQRTELPSEIDQPHRVNAVLRWAAGAEPPAGGFFGELLKNSSSSLVFRAASGLPYTPIPDETGLGFSPDRGDINSARGPATWQFDAYLAKDFWISNLRYGLFVRVINLTDRKNCIQVSQTTGRCDSGAFLFLNRRTGNPAGEGQSSTAYDRATYVGQRRSIALGARVSF